MSEVEEVKSRLDIVEVVGQYVALQKAGRTFKAACPFHAEKTPSFIVSPDRQSWHCFGACGTGGDVISFVMRREGLEFPDALRVLAERAGVRLKERRVSQEQDRARERLYTVNEAAARWFRSLLAGDSARAAREYLQGRGIDESVAEAFQLGYSPQAWSATLDQLRGLGFTDRELLAAGLVVEGESGLHDRFRGRLMFPIWDARGRVIGFGARALDDGGAGPGQQGPKYINTSQTALFDKGGVLYALHRAQEGIRREGTAVIVEGYMDAIAAHQHGFDHVVASMGTALTERQVRLLKRLAPQVVLALDADAAGSEAAVRGHDVVREALAGSDVVPVVSWRGLVGYQEAVAIDLRVAVLPDGKDPDDVIRADPEKWRALIAGAEPVLDYRLRAVAAAHDMSEPRGRSRFVQEFLPLLTAVTDPVVRAHYLQRLSRMAQTGEEELSGMLRALAARKKSRPGNGAAAGAAGSDSGDAREEFLLALLLQYPHLRQHALEIPLELLWRSENRQVLAAWREWEELEAVKEAVPLELRPHVERLSLRRLPSLEPAEALEALRDCREKLEERNLEAEKQALDSLIAAFEDELGAAALAGAAIPAGVDEERVQEAMRLHARAMELGLRMHRKERSDPFAEGCDED